jgi:hypothetical protein
MDGIQLGSLLSICIGRRQQPFNTHTGGGRNAALRGLDHSVNILAFEFDHLQHEHFVDRRNRRRKTALDYGTMALPPPTA